MTETIQDYQLQNLKLLMHWAKSQKKSMSEELEHNYARNISEREKLYETTNSKCKIACL